MQARGYFVSDQAENNEKLHNLEKLKKATEDQKLLAGKLKRVGSLLADFARVLMNPDGYVFDISNDYIYVGQPGEELRRPVARLTPSEMDWNDLRETLGGYIKAKVDKRDAAATLGLPPMA
jgi:hypothetical protein